MKTGRRGSGPFLVLENCYGSFDDLVTVKTGSNYKKEVTDIIKRNLEIWLANPEFDNVRSSLLDLAIIARISAQKMTRQDVDNISKVVLDALQKSGNDMRFLFYDDKQVIRLLVWKIQQEEDSEQNTDTLGISFRIHDPKKQMILEMPSRI